MDPKLLVSQYESILANLARILQAKLPQSKFKQRSIMMLFERYLTLHTDFESKEEDGK